MNSGLRSSHIASLVLIALFAVAPNVSHAAGVSFSSDLHYGMHSVAVGQLQDFLRTEGYFNDDISDGFFSETRAAVQAWQVANCLPSTGYFGTLSRQAAAMGSSFLSASTTLSANLASSTPASVVTSSASDNGPIVMLNGKYYVRTTNGLMPIHGGIPHSNSTMAAPAAPPAPVTTYTLTVSKTGSSGDGTVTSSPAGISCGASCSSSYALGTIVTLTATADGSSSFFGWLGACSGTGSCTVTMNADTSVVAVFPINLSTNPPPDLGES